MTPAGVAVAEKLRALELMAQTEPQTLDSGLIAVEREAVAGHLLSALPFLADVVQAMERIAQLQPEALKIIEDNGFVFDSIGREPGNWQHLAFTLYSSLCEAESFASPALTALREHLEGDA